jgi:hypothetical protein
MALIMSRNGMIGVPKMPRFEGSILIKDLNPLYKCRDLIRPSTFQKALFMATNKRTL